MEYKLFEDFITLQALLKDLRIIQSGGAVKAFLSENTVLFNGQDEKRRGKKLRLGDQIELPKQDISIILVAPSSDELKLHVQEEVEKKRVTAMVKKLSQNNKKEKQAKGRTGKRPPVKFPGT
ncbi:S4 domain-containing protein YaaA [Streptococcus dentapri]|uniref:S4 domain-containing protein YaaA n=1 Tax=Streptococcus dentapri TaxID=573564 RepID=A0ABV8D2G0_9STRE